MPFDVAVIGAGIAGLTCAQQLHQAGYAVMVLEKSRGVGGRVATRRLPPTWADHGTCYLSPQDESFRQWVEWLVAQGILHIWTEQIYELTTGGKLQAPIAPYPRYASPLGLTAIAKVLATGLAIEYGQRVRHLQPTGNTWHLTCASSGPDASPLVIEAKAVVVAIPAPQAVALIQSEWDVNLYDRLRTVEFAPCLSAIALYGADQQPAAPALGWQGVRVQGSDVAWIGLDSSKQAQPSLPVLVVQSTAEFAIRHLETADLQPVGQQLLATASQLADWFCRPTLLQVHRWRYAFAIAPWPDPYLMATTPLPLFCTGDWCGGNRVESAWLAGQATAHSLNEQLQQRSLTPDFWRSIAIKNPQIA